MIDTTYFPLGKAAEILKSDPDTLLTAGIEGRIKLYGLLGRHVTLSSGLRLINNSAPEEPSSYGEDTKSAWIDFFPIDRNACSSILKTGVSEEIYWISEEDDGEQWQISDHEDLQIFVEKTAVFIQRTTVEQIIAQGTPEKGIVPDRSTEDTHKGHANRRSNNLLRVIAAMMDQLHLSVEKHGVQAQVSEWTECIGARVGPDTVKKILQEATELVKVDAKKANKT